MVREVEGARVEGEGWRWRAELDAWLSPEVCSMLDAGEPVIFERDGLGFLLRGSEPAVVYPLEPISATRH